MKEFNYLNIISFYSVFEKNNTYKFFQKSIQGGELLKQGLQKSIRDARIVAKQLVLCLYYMHQKGIMHKNLKPQNIQNKSNFLDVLIANFDLTTQIKAQKQQYYHCEITGYVAPEILMYVLALFSVNQFSILIHQFKESTKAGMLKWNLVDDYKLDDLPKSCQNSKQRAQASSILRHDFFNKPLNELSYPSLTRSIQDISDHKKSGY